MKKFTLSLVFIILCSCLLVCFNGCSDNSKLETINGKTASQVYQQITTSIEQAKNYSYTIDYTINESLVSQNNASLSERKFTTTLQKNNDDYVYTTVLDISSISPKKTILYTKKVNTFFNGWLYRKTEQIFNDQPFTSKVKDGTYSFAHSLVKLGKDESAFVNPIPSFTRAELKDILFNSSDSKIFFELFINGDTAKEQVKDLLLNTNVATSNYDCNSICYKFYVDQDGNFVDMLVSFTAKATTNNIDYSYNYHGVVTLFDIGNTSVSAPVDADSYSAN